jgi:hypothetical protein
MKKKLVKMNSSDHVGEKYAAQLTTYQDKDPAPSILPYHSGHVPNTLKEK